MNYQTFQPHPNLEALIKCYWTLEVPVEFDAPKQRIVSDGCLEMAFLLGDEIKRYTSETTFILQPRSMVIGQIIEPFFIQPIGYVNTFAIRFYPYGFANFVNTPIKDLSDKETPLASLFGEKVSQELEQKIVQASDTKERIAIAEDFLLNTLNNKKTIDKIVRDTVDSLISSSGNTSINSLVKSDSTKRRQLERKFVKQIGLSPKQLGKVLRLQASLKMLLSEKSDKLSNIAYEGEYYDQAHFNRDFKEFTGTSPTAFLNDKNMALSSLIYKND
ncbi:AraC family transcriptional regulator [Chryseotalea sanaruensis]|uniref:AraC family transcriptional regulator n=1 Tax=Chryseotalea sanaruensis TaxID=2482724 RepID=A0A401U9N2_9BACT|nr:helix-turn-helix domain-containing protein [Chryseotalea sanaruensis]GCC51595.1 AraC family transcriptional regulator [Chryseotalea sanaruensis]